MNTPQVPTGIVKGVPNLNTFTPYISLAYDNCPVSDLVEYGYCISRLAEATSAAADTLAGKLMQTSPEKNAHKLTGYYDELHADIQSVQQAKENYINAYCSLDNDLMYGATGADVEVWSCRYYYDLQYLNLLKKLEKDVKP